MRVVSVVVGIVVCTVALGLGGCSNQTCTTSSCVGCCSADGVCVAGSQPVACGTGGAQCTTCSFADSCVNGACSSFSTATGGGVGATGGGAGSSDAGAAAVRAFNIVVDEVTISDPSCYRLGELPASPQFIPSRTAEILLWASGGFDFLAVREIGSYKLGSAPTIEFPAATTLIGSDFSWTRSSREPESSAWTNVRTTTGKMSFSELSVTEIEGTLSLESTYQCVAENQQCPIGELEPADSASCSVVLRLRGTEVPLSSRWTNGDAGVVSNASSYLAAIDLAPTTVLPRGCFSPGPFGDARAATQLSVVNWFGLDVFQRFTVGGDFVRMSRGDYRLGQAPIIAVSGDLRADAGTFVWRQSVSSSSPSATETRAVGVTLGPWAVGGETVSFGLSSEYRCEGQSCPTDPYPNDAAACAVASSVHVRLLP